MNFYQSVFPENSVEKIFSKRRVWGSYPSIYLLSLVRAIFKSTHNYATNLWSCNEI